MTVDLAEFRRSDAITITVSLSSGRRNSRYQTQTYAGGSDLNVGFPEREHARGRHCDRVGHGCRQRSATRAARRRHAADDHQGHRCRRIAPSRCSRPRRSHPWTMARVPLVTRSALTRVDVTATPGPQSVEIGRPGTDAAGRSDHVRSIPVNRKQPERSGRQPFPRRSRMQRRQHRRSTPGGTVTIDTTGPTMADARSKSTPARTTPRDVINASSQTAVMIDAQFAQPTDAGLRHAHD